MNHKEKMKQITKEAKAVLLSLVAIILFWCIAGLGVSHLSITIFHTPLWVITGCFGTWIFAVVLIYFLTKLVFKDFDLDEEVEKDA